MNSVAREWKCEEERERERKRVCSPTMLERESNIIRSGERGRVGKRVVVETKGSHKRAAPGICKNNNHHHFPFTFTALWSRAFNLFSPSFPIYPSSTTLSNCTPASKVLFPHLPLYPHPHFLNDQTIILMYETVFNCPINTLN